MNGSGGRRLTTKRLASGTAAATVVIKPFQFTLFPVQPFYPLFSLLDRGLRWNLRLIKNNEVLWNIPNRSMAPTPPWKWLGESVFVFFAILFTIPAIVRGNKWFWKSLPSWRALLAKNGLKSSQFRLKWCNLCLFYGVLLAFLDVM